MSTTHLCTDVVPSAARRPEARRHVLARLSPEEREALLRRTHRVEGALFRGTPRERFAATGMGAQVLHQPQGLRTQRFVLQRQ